MRVTIAQTKPVTGDLHGNTQQILAGIAQAKQDQAEFVVFPETAITGYCCGSLYEQEEFIRDNKKQLEDIIAQEVTDDLVAVVGFVDYRGRQFDGSMDITNSAAIIQNQKIIGIYDKILMANDGHHEDRKYFTPGEEASVFDVTVRGNKYRIGTPICEDAWSTNHQRNIVEEMSLQKADAILCLNQSYFYTGKEQVRHELFSRHAKTQQMPIVMANAAGVGDILKNILIYDGSSTAYNASGEQIAHLQRFSSDVQTVDLTSAGKKPAFQDEQKELFDALVFEQEELYKSLGIKKAQVHISGGLDSAVTAAIVQQAMGSENCVFISNPTECNFEATRSNAQTIADALEVPLHWNEMQKPYQALMESFTESFGETKPLIHSTAHAVGRTVQGLMASNHHQTGIVATGNHTEIVEGWANFHDIGSIGVHAPLGDLTKVELYTFAESINRILGKEVIPQNLYNGDLAAKAELPDADDDPLDYFVRSGTCAEFIRNKTRPQALIKQFERQTLDPALFPQNFENKSVYERYSIEEFANEVMQSYTNSQRSVFKAGQSAPIAITKPRSRGFSSRETIINRYQPQVRL